MLGKRILTFVGQAVKLRFSSPGCFSKAALTLVDDLNLDGYHLYHAIRADLLRRLGRRAEAALAYEAALARTENAVEREFLRRSRQALTQD